MTCNTNDDDGNGDGVDVEIDIISNMIIMILMIIQHCWWGRSSVIWRDGDWQTGLGDERRPPETSIHIIPIVILGDDPTNCFSSSPAYSSTRRWFDGQNTSYQAWSLVMVHNHPTNFFSSSAYSSRRWFNGQNTSYYWSIIIPPSVIHDSNSSIVKWFYGLYALYQSWPMVMIHNQEAVQHHDDFRMIPGNREQWWWWSIACIVGIILTLPLAFTELSFLLKQILILNWAFNFR